MQELPLGKRRLELSLKLDALIALRSVKRFFTLRELSELLELPISVISRYVAGEVSPSKGTASRILGSLMSPSFTRNYLGRALERVGWDINSLFKDPAFLTFMSLYFRSELLKSVAGSRLDLIIVCDEPSGLLASAILPYVDAGISYVGSSGSKDLKNVKTVAVLAAYLSKEAINELRNLRSSHNLRVVIIEALIAENPEDLRNSFPEAVTIHLLP